MRRTTSVVIMLSFLTSAPNAVRAERSCAWQARMDPGVVNTAYPDQYANYWFLALPAAPGASLTLKGLYPHARYMSVVSYAGAAQSADGLNDLSIAPDAGSENPFIGGHRRDTADEVRHWTVTVRYVAPNELPPTVREPNTVYTSNADGSKRGTGFVLIYRVYRPDATYDARGDITGGVGLPDVTYNLADGSSAFVSHCPYQELPANPVNGMVANAGQPQSGSNSLMYPGFNPPVWHKFQNFARSLSQGATENGYTGTTFSDAVKPAADALPPGGFLDNTDNNYIFTLLSHGYGPIAVFRGALPSTPDTFPNTEVMPPPTQLRYWSICSNDGPSQRFYGCADDNLVRPTMDGDHFTVVVSKAADKPASVSNGTCHCVWLPWGPSSSSVIIVRNMLPLSRDQFPNAIQYASYGNEKAGLGPYHPQGCYMTVAQFDAGTRCSI